MTHRWTWWTQLALLLVLAAVFAVTRGLPGLWGSLIGSVVVLVFFSSTIVVIGPIAHVSPAMSQPLAVLFFLTKALALAALFVVLGRSESVPGTIDPVAVSTAVIAGAVMWIIGHTIDLVRARIPTYDLPDLPPDDPDRISER